MTEIEILQEGRFYGAKGFDFPSLKEALTQAVQEQEAFLFFADKVMGLMVALPHSPTSMWQKHPSRSKLNKQGGWYETNLQEFKEDFGF